MKTDSLFCFFALASAGLLACGGSDATLTGEADAIVKATSCSGAAPAEARLARGLEPDDFSGFAPLELDKALVKAFEGAPESCGLCSDRLAALTYASATAPTREELLEALIGDYSLRLGYRTMEPEALASLETYLASRALGDFVERARFSIGGCGAVEVGLITDETLGAPNAMLFTDTYVVHFPDTASVLLLTREAWED